MPSAAAVQSSTLDTQFHILSFEGPDGYARAGGIASRITGLSEALAEAGLETHLWFVGALITADIVHLRTPLDPESCRVLYRSSAAVLANSGREPFGLVGLETMAAGGVACTGGTGEDYVVPGQNALVLETADPWEFVALFRELRANPARDRALRRAGRTTAEQYSWSHVVRRVLLPRLHVVAEH